MQNGEENGIVYYIDQALFQKARDMAERKANKNPDLRIIWSAYGVALIQEAERSLEKIQGVLDEMREIALDVVENPDADYKVLSRRLNALKREIDGIVSAAIASGTNFIGSSAKGLRGTVDAVNEAITALVDTIREPGEGGPDPKPAENEKLEKNGQDN